MINIIRQKVKNCCNTAIIPKKYIQYENMSPRKTVNLAPDKLL